MQWHTIFEKTRLSQMIVVYGQLNSYIEHLELQQRSILKMSTTQDCMSKFVFAQRNDFNNGVTQDEVKEILTELLKVQSFTKSKCLIYLKWDIAIFCFLQLLVKIFKWPFTYSIWRKIQSFCYSRYEILHEILESCTNEFCQELREVWR